MDRIAELEKEEKFARKSMKVGIRAAFSAGIGLAVFLLQKIFSGMAPDDGMNAIIDGVCLMLVAYAGVVVATFIFRRRWILRVNMAMTWLVMPAIVIHLLMTHL